jgi:hypothetical protein
MIEPFAPSVEDPIDCCTNCGATGNWPASPTPSTAAGSSADGACMVVGDCSSTLTLDGTVERVEREGELSSQVRILFASSGGATDVNAFVSRRQCDGAILDRTYCEQVAESLKRSTRLITI